MAGNLFSRLVPSKDGSSRSFYEQLRDGEDVDIENRAGLALDEENLSHQFHDDDLDNAEGLTDSRMSTGTTVTAGRTARRAKSKNDRQDARWLSPEDDGDNDVPASLLVEHHTKPAQRTPRGENKQASRESTLPGPSTRRTQAQWETAQAQQKLHSDEDEGLLQNGSAVPARRLGFNSNPKEKAMFRWANVSNLDNFMRDVYDYYLGAGIWCILLDRFLHLLKGVFVAALLTLLTQCIDYSKIRESKSLSQIMVPQCTKHMWGIWNLGLWLCSFYVIWKTIQFALDIPRLLHMRDFYVYLLEIPEEDMQTVSWQDVVSRITALRDQNVRTASNITPSARRFLAQQLGRPMNGQAKERLDAHDIANRLMRRENYIIAMFNKDILDLSVPLPFMRNSQFFSHTLLWTLQFSILDLVFDEKNQVREAFLKGDRRMQLSRKLRNRFVFAGALQLLSFVFVAAFLLIDFIFTYYNEYKTNSSFFGLRQYTPLAEWRFREFNELPHFFRERLNMSYPFAKHYIDQFPKKKTEAAAKAVRFFAGALIVVSAVIAFSDPEMIVDFEIFPGMNAFAFVAVCTTVWAVAHGMITEENEVFDPEYAMRNVIEYTHYEPDQWKGRLHSYDVKAEFSELYKLKIVIVLEEILGIILTPLILLISLPKCADQIVDFFREFTIHVDGLGYVCSFAVFDFQKDPRNTTRHTQQPGAVETAAQDAREDYYATKHNKMQASIYGFLDNYVYNPRSGLPGSHLPLGPAGRHQFHPPPAFPGLNSPTLAADMRASRFGAGTGIGGRPQSQRQQQQQLAVTPRFGPQPSPMASMLLDPHHQPSASLLGTGARRPTARLGRPPYLGEGGGITEETGEDDAVLTSDLPPSQRQPSVNLQRQYTDDSMIEESVARLGESTWEGSPRQAALSRETTGGLTVGTGSSEGGGGTEGEGVATMLKAFRQAHMNPSGGVL